MTGSNKVIVAQCGEVMTVQVEGHSEVGLSSKAAHQVYKARIVIQNHEKYPLRWLNTAKGENNTKGDPMPRSVLSESKWQSGSLMVSSITPADMNGWDQGHITLSGVPDDNNLALIL